jgi:hypothetical protein
MNQSVNQSINQSTNRFQCKLHSNQKLLLGSKRPTVATRVLVLRRRRLIGATRQHASKAFQNKNKISSDYILLQRLLLVIVAIHAWYCIIIVYVVHVRVVRGKVAERNATGSLSQSDRASPGWMR